MTSTRTLAEKQSIIDSEELTKETQRNNKLTELQNFFRDCYDNYSDYIANQKAKEHNCRARMYRILPRVMKYIKQDLDNSGL